MRATLADVVRGRSGETVAEGDDALWMPPGHFYSPIPSVEEVEARAHEVFATPAALPAIELSAEAQVSLLAELLRYESDAGLVRRPHSSRRYYAENDQFGYQDALVLHCMLRHLAPARLIEVGSGYSSAVVLDVDERFLAWQTACTFIDPYPDRLRSLLKSGDEERIELLPERLQDVPTEVFERLGPGDVLFVDSSHVSKTDSDVNHVLFRVLPALHPGVHVHFHDIFYPFEYPRDWLYEGRAWNEAYALRAFLSYNGQFEIELFVSFLSKLHPNAFAGAVPLGELGNGGSIWIRKIGASAARA